MFNMMHDKDFDDLAKKSWQSFSTMKRFVAEANRLENASWRLWFMQKNSPDLVPTKSLENIKEYETTSSHVVCTYCEIHRASLSCHGCCHDAYCVSCFKLIHKKGHLATHTAMKIKRRYVERLSPKKDKERCSQTPITSHNSLSNKIPDHSVHTNPNTENTLPTQLDSQNLSASKRERRAHAESWEVRMDMMLQRLMVNSIDRENDISVRNIDRRNSLNISFLAEPENEQKEEVGENKQSDITSSDQHIDEYKDETTVMNDTFLLTPPTKSKYRKKASICANCNGNHITIDCPLLESSIATPPPTSSFCGLPGSHSSNGVDTVLRKCFTTIHNDNLSNSTHAFLGDEISVRGGGHFNKVSPETSRNVGIGFRMNTITDDHNEDEIESILPALPGYKQRRSWDATQWLISCLATELPHDVYHTLRQAEQLVLEDTSPSISGWVYLKQSSTDSWSKRYIVLYRNSLWEYLDENKTNRPIGYANITESTLIISSSLDLELEYYQDASSQSIRTRVYLQMKTRDEMMEWKIQLMMAATFQLEDLFDMTPKHRSNSLFPSETNVYELGKGRFSSVQRACRKRHRTLPNTSDDCALKMIDKHLFWTLVAQETEREDTIIRELLTQTVLTVRAMACKQYCPIIRLRSLFETRQYLVMELELMREGDLHEEIVTNSAIEEPRAAIMIASLVRAVEFCLQNGIAHRDIKLSNLALDVADLNTNLRVIKMADFGMAAFIQENGTLTGRCGTPGFVAPEILTAGKGESYPMGVDMFSVGVVTYTILCGYEPFFGVNDQELIQMNKMVAYEFEEPEWTSISQDAKDLIAAMMEKDYNKRITTTQALIHPYLKQANKRLEQVLKSNDETTLRLL